MFLEKEHAIAVIKLESEPPDKKVPTGTSATRCFSTHFLIKFDLIDSLHLFLLILVSFELIFYYPNSF